MFFAVSHDIYIILTDSPLGYANALYPFIVAVAPSALVFLFGFVNNLLYWSKSGVYVSDKGDHIVYIAGLNSKEDKLLNMSVVANQITRGPLEQIFGVATMTTGLFENRPISGIRYADIKAYDDMMRNNTPSNMNSVL